MLRAAVLAVITLIACERQLPESNGARSVINFEELSGKILNNHFADMDELVSFLTKRKVEYTLTPITEDYLVIRPTSCANRVGRNFKFAYLRLEGTIGGKLYRYRLYWQQAGPFCIEEDFAFKNPYE